MSQLKIKYDTEVVALPGKVTEVMDRVSFTELKVLLALCASKELCRAYGSEDWAQRVSETADCATDDVHAAIGFWRGVGIISVGEGERKKSAKATQPVKNEIEKTDTPAASQKNPSADTDSGEKAIKLRPKAELPHYTTDQLAALLEAHADTAHWLDECQRIFGKIFNTLEVNTILGFVDYLGLDWEYVMTLLSYYVSMQEQRGMPKSLRSVEKMAFDFYDREIRTTADLQSEIHRLRLFSETEGKLRTLFGMGERSLTPKEKKYFSAWLYEYGYGMDIIRLAYDVTVDATGKATINYMNSVLANWNKDGLRTPEAIKAADEVHKAGSMEKVKGKKKSETPQGSFDTDDFFAAAVRRSFGDQSEDQEKP